MSFTNDIPDVQSTRNNGKWKAVCLELIQSEYRAVKIETDSRDEANRVRLAAFQAAKRSGLNVRPTQRGSVVYLVNMGWESAQK